MPGGIADLVGTHRETITRTLGDFRDRGLIALTRSQVEVLDTDGLREIGGSWRLDPPPVRSASRMWPIGAGGAMQPNESVIREFLAAWARLDADELTAYFTDDIVYHNMPGAPVAGRDDVTKRIRAFLSGWTETSWDILNLLCEGDLVMVERVDRTKSGEKRVDLPCVGVFLMRDGKIAVWRDYFDLATYQRAMA